MAPVAGLGVVAGATLREKREGQNIKRELRVDYQVGEQLRRYSSPTFIERLLVS